MKLAPWVSVTVSAFAGGALSWLQTHNMLTGSYGLIAGATMAGLIAVAHLYQSPGVSSD